MKRGLFQALDKRPRTERGSKLARGEPAMGSKRERLLNNGQPSSLAEDL